MRLQQRYSCYTVPLHMEAAYLVEPATSTRREHGFWREQAYQEKTHRKLYGGLLSIKQRLLTKVVYHLVHFE